MERMPQRPMAYRPPRCWRAAWAASTCLSAVALWPLAARAQSLPPTTTPTGGAVAAGNAAISQTTGQTVITQSSQNAAINWQSFNVGSAASVQFKQPDANATTLNRVIAANPSVIAGRIDANGNIIIVNQSGIVFAKGSEVDAHGVIASTADVADGDFMKGNLAFSGAPRPGAKIINDGHITVHDTGLVGLIAPQVANNGVITARLGQVVLAGAATFTLDLYGDRLISLDVTKAVRAVDVGGKPVAALVTNSGLILADGGKIVLTAQDADALVTQLIDAGGTIRADTVGSRTGSIAITGVGGSINIAGNLLVQGKGSASVGGAVEALSDGAVNVAPTARIDASGAAGGGVIAVGTDLARARQGAADTAAPRAARVTIAAGAQLAANATAKGSAGTVTLLSADDTDFAGTISVTGGPQGGNGGLAEISSNNDISLGGTVLDTAIDGQAGEVLLDPLTLVVGTGNPAAATATVGGVVTVGGFDTAVTTSYVDPSQLSLLGGTIVLEAHSLLSVASAIDLTASSSALSLVSQGDVTVHAGITVNGSLEIDAANSLALVNGTLNAGNILLSSGIAGTALDMPVVATGQIAIGSTGAVIEGTGGSLTGTLISVGTIGGGASFTQANSLTALGPFADATTLALTDNGSLTLIGSITAGDIYLAAGTLSDGGAPVSLVAGAAGAPGVLALGADALAFGAGSTLAAPAGTIEIGPRSAGVIDIGGAAGIGTLGLPASLTALLGSTASLLSIGTASLGGLSSAAAATIALDGSANFHTAALTLSATSLVSDNAGTLTAGDVTLSTGSFAQAGSAAIATTLLTATGTLAGLSALGSANAVGTLGNVAVTSTGTLVFTDTGLLTTGALTAGAATLAAPTLNVGGALDVAGALALAGLTGGATQSAPITAGTLTGQGALAGGITFANGLNSLASLGNLSLTGTGALDIATTGTLNLPGAITAPGGVSLSAGALIAQPGGGAITAATTDELALLRAPTISLAGTLAAPATGAEIALEANTLSLAGTLNAAQGAVAIAPFTGNSTIVVGGAPADGTLALDPAALGSITADALLLGSLDGVAATNTALVNISAPLTTASELGLFSAAGTGAVLESGTGSLRAPRLVGATGTLILDNASNFLDTIGAAPLPLAGTTLTGGFSVASSLTVAENVDLTIGGSVTAGTLVALRSAALTVNGAVTAPTVSLAATSGNLMLNGFVSAVSALVLASSGDITESGNLTAGTLDTGSLGGALSLTGTNTITDLGAVSLSAGHALALDDAVPLTLIGSLEAPSAAFDLPSLAIAAPVSIAGALLLTSLTAGASQSAAITAGTLRGAGTLGTLILTAGNSIGTLGGLSFGAAGALDLVDTGSLEIAGALSGNSATLSAGTIGIDAPVSLTGGLTLAGLTGGVTQTAALTLGTLAGAGSLGGSLALGDAGNAIGTLGGLTIGGDLLLDSGRVVTLPADVEVGGNITLAGAGFTETSTGTLSAQTLSTRGEVAGDLILGDFDASTSPFANTIAALGNVTAAGTLRLDDPGATLTVGNGDTAASVLLQSPSILGAGTLLATGAGAPLDLFAFTIAPGLHLSDLLGTILEDNPSPAPFTLSSFSPGNVTGKTIQFGGPDSTGLTIASAGDLDFGTLSVALVTTGSIADESGTLSAANLLLDATGFTQAAAAVIDVGTLGGFGTAQSALLLTDPANSLAVLGALSLTGDATLAVFDATALTIAASITAGAVTLAPAGALVLDAGIEAGSAILLGAGGAVTENGAGLGTPLLESLGSIAGDVQLLGPGNAIGTLGSFAATSLALTQTGALTIAGPVSLTGATLDVGTLSLPGSLSATDLTLVDLSGGATETGALSVTTLSASGLLTGAVALGGANSIATLGAVAADQLTLVDLVSLDIAGSLTGGNVTLGAPALGLSAPISLTGALILESLTGNLSQSAAIDVATLGAHGGLGGDVVLTNAGNSISVLGDLSLGSGATLALADAAPLALTGTLTAGTIDLTGTDVRQSAGALDAAILSVGASGTVAIGGARNSVASLAGLTGTAILLADTGTLDVTGSVAAGSLTLTVPTLGLDAGLSITGLLALGGLDGGVTQTAPFAAGTLASQGSLSGLIALGESNRIGTLGDFAAGTLALGDAQALVLAGDVTLASLSFSSLAAGATQVGGALALGSLAAGHAAGDLRLDEAGNVIAALGTITTGTLSLIDAVPLTIAGSLTAAEADLNAPSLAIDAPVSLTGALILAGLGGLTEAGTGGVTAATLAGSGALGGAILLTGTNAIAALGTLNANTFTLIDTGALTIAGALTAADATLSASSIAQAAAISLTGALTLADLADGYGQTSPLRVGTLVGQGTFDGALGLDDPANAIGTLGELATRGSLYIADSEPLTLAGTIDVGALTLQGQGVTQVSGALSATILDTAGTLAGDLLLGQSGSALDAIATLGNITALDRVAIDDAGLMLVAGTVAAIDVGLTALSLIGTGTVIASAITPGSLGLLDIAANYFSPSVHLRNVFEGQAGTIDFGNATPGPLIIAGDYSSFNTGGTIALGNSFTTDITIAGASTFGSNAAALFAFGTIYDDAGALTATSLAFSAAALTQAAGAAIEVGAVSSVGPSASAILLGGTGNQFADLGTLALAVSGTLAIDDTGPLTVTAPLDAAVVSLAATGALMLAADITASSLVALQSGGDIGEGAFAITAPTLISLGSIAGDVSLTGGNVIGTLGAFTATALQFGDSEPLVIAGPVSLSSGALTVSALAITGSVNAGSLGLSGITGGVSETGSLVVTSLSGTGLLTGGISLTGTNSIADLGPLAADRLILADAGSLDITGALTADTATLSAPGLRLDAPVSLTTALALAGLTTGIAQTQPLTVPTLSGSGPLSGTLLLTDPHNDIGTLGDLSLSAGTLAIGDDVALTLAGQLQAPTGLISLAAPSETETTGEITAGTLQASAAGAITLLGGANSIASLSTLAAGTLLLSDAGSLDITGPVGVAAASLAVPTIGLDGNVDVTGLLTLGSLVAALTQNSGALAAATLATDAGAAGTIILSAPGNAIGTLGNVAGAALDIADAASLDLAGNITLGGLALDNDAGNVGQSAGTLIVATLTAPGDLTGNIALQQPGDAIGTIGLATASTLVLSQAGALTIAGPVSLAAATIGVAGLDITGSLAVAGELLITSLASGLTATGAVSAGTLSGLGSLTGPIEFTSGDNAVATLGDITTASFVLFDAGPLGVTGTLDVPALTLSSPSLVLAGAIDAAQLALGGGAIGQTGGRLNVVSLSSDGAITGGLSLQGGANSIAALGDITLAGTLALIDQAPLSIAGTLIAGALDLAAPRLTFAAGQASSIGGQAILSGASSIELDAALTVAGELDLISPGTIAEGPAAAIVAQRLASGGAADGEVTLLSAQNRIDTLGGFTAADLQIADMTLLTVAGPVAVSHDVTLGDDSGLAIDGPLSAQGGTVALLSDQIMWGGGQVSAGSVIAIAPQTPDVLIDIGGTSPGLSLSPGLIGALTAATIVIGAGGPVTVQSILNDGAVSFHSDLDLVAGAGFSQTGAGTIDGATVSIAAPRVVLAGLLGAGGDVAVTAGGTIDLPGTVTGQDITLSAPSLAPTGLVSATGTLALLTAGVLTDAGTLAAATLTFSAAAIAESVAGPIDAGLLTGTATGGAVYLTNAANSIASLGPITVAGDFDLDNAAGLRITAPVTAKNIDLIDTAGAVSLAAAGSLIAAAGALIVTSDTLAASAGAAFDAATGILFTPATGTRPIDLGGTESGALDLSATVLAAASAPSLTIATVGSLLAAGIVTLGPVATLLLDAGGIDFTGSLALAGTNALLALASTAPVTEASGAVLTAGTLATDGSLSTDILLTGAGNSIGTLGGITLGAGDSFALDDAGTIALVDRLIAGAADLVAGTTLVVGATGTIITDQGLTLAAPTIADFGVIAAGTLLALDGAASVAEAAGATIGAGTLAGDDPGGTIDLSAAGNSIADIGSLTAASLTFDDATPLTVTGALDVATATLMPGTVTLAGDVEVAGLLLFPGLTGGLIQSAGTLTAGTLVSQSADAGTVSLGDPGNAIGTLGLITADHLLLVDAGPLIVTGPVTAPTATLAAGSLTLAGVLTDSTRLALDDTGGIDQVAGSLGIGTLASDGADAGPVLLTRPGNSIAALGAFTMATGSLALVTAGTLTLAGATTLAVADLQAGSIVGAGDLTGDVVTLAAAGIDLRAGLTAATALTVLTPGDAAETADGVITAALLTTGAGTIGGNLDLGNANSIAAIADIAVPAGALTLNDATSLLVAGVVTAATGSLTAAALDLEGTLDIGGSLALADNGPGGITLAGLTSIGSLLSLNANGGVVETGTLTAATLAGSFAGGNVTLGGTNSLAVLGSLSLGADTLSLADLAALTIAGPVSAAAASIAAAGIAVPGTVATSGDLVLSAPSLGGTGALSAGGTLDLQSATIVDISGNVAAATLSSGATTLGDVTLTGRNEIGALGGLTASGALDLADDEALLVAGPVAAAGVTLTAPAVTFAGDVDAGSSLLLAGLQSGVRQTAGTVSAVVLADLGADAGTISLLGSANNIGTLGNLSLISGDLLFSDAADLTIGGPLGVAVAEISAPNLQVLGPIAASALTIAGGTLVGLHARLSVATDLDLNDDGNVRETGAGAITAATLNATGTLGGNLNLPGGNTIGTLGLLAVPNGQLILADDVGLTIAGAVSASTATLTAASIDLTGTVLSAGELDLAATGPGGLVLPGSLAAAIVSLASAGGIAQTGGLTAATLTGSAAGPAILTGADSIATLGAFTAPGQSLTLADLSQLTIAGPIGLAGASISAAGLTLTGMFAATGAVTLAGGGIALTGALQAGSTLALLSAGPVTGAGALSAPTLTTDGLTDGDITLADARTTIASLFDLAASSLNLVDQSALSAAEVTVPVVSLIAPSLNLAGDVTAADLFAVAAAGGVSQSAGTLTAGRLSSDGATNGPTSLTDGGNVIGTLGAYALGESSLALADSTGLTVAGPLTGAGIALSAPGLDLSGTIAAGSGLTLASTGAIGQTGGLIATPTLSSGAGGIGGDLSLLAPNSIAVLGTLSDAGNVALATVETLTLAEPVIAANVSISAAGLDLNAPFTTGVLQIATTGPVNETGALTVATLTTGAGSIAGALVLNAANHIADLGSFTATGGLSLNDAVPLTIDGPVDLGGALALDAAGITQTGGTIAAPALTSDGGTIAGNVALGQAGNAIPTLGDFAATGDITLADASPLTLTGNLANGAGIITLVDSAGLTQTGGVITTGLLNADATNIILPDANLIAALGNVATGTLAVSGVSATTGQLDAQSVTIAAPGAISLSGTAHIAGDLSLTTTGDIIHTAGILDAGTLTGTAGQLASFAASTDFGTIGSFIMADSAFDLVNTGPLSLDGPLVANTASISASGVLTLAGSVVGGLYVTGAPAADTLTQPRTGVDTVLIGSSIKEIGTFYINAGPGAALYNSQAALGTSSPAASIFLLTVANPGQAGGPIALSLAGIGLDAPAADIIVDAGTTGTMTGNLNAQHLEVLGGLDSEFTGTIDGLTGQSAAGKANTFPVALSRYQFNACPIGSVDCQIINIEAVPATNPLGNFDVTQRKRRRLDKNVQLPGIATHDF